MSNIDISRNEGVATAYENLIEGQNKALEMAIAGKNIHDILEVLVLTVEAQSIDPVLGSVLLLDDDGQHLHHGAAPSIPDAYNNAIDGLRIGAGVGSCGSAAFTGKTVIVKDIQTDPFWKDFKALAGEHGLAACWSKPILSSNGKVLGTFALYSKIAGEPNSHDQEVVDLLGKTAALLIERDQTEQRRQRMELAAIEDRRAELRRIQAMFENAPAAVASVRGPDHVFEMANLQYLQLSGKSNLSGKTVREAFPELEGQGFFELLDQVRSTGEPYIGKATQVMLEREGELVEAFVDFVYQPVPDKDGKAESILVVAFDVTDLVSAKLKSEAARNQAEESERTLLRFVNNLPELAWTALPDGHIDFYNKRWYEYTGTTFEEMEGWGWEKVHDPQLLPLVVDRWRHSLESGEPFEMEFTLRGADGIRRWFLTRVAAVRDSDGNIVRWFGTNTNIDNLKSTEALTAAISEQSIEYQQVLLELRSRLEATEAKLHELTSKKEPRA